MEKAFLNRQDFDKLDYTNQPLLGKEFTACTFTNCNFSNVILLDKDFIDCRFENCNLSNTKLRNTGLKIVKFINCKLIGVDFNECKDLLFSVYFERCQLDFSSFVKRDLKKTMFHDCVIKEADFTDANLSEAQLLNCNLLRTVFNQTNLTATDLRTAYNYSINPEINNIKKAKFTYPSVMGLLDRFDIEVS